MLASVAITAMIALPATAQESSTAGGGSAGGASGGTASGEQPVEQPVLELVQQQGPQSVE